MCVSDTLTLDAERAGTLGRGAGEPHLGRPVAGEHLDVAEAPRLEPEGLGDRLLGAEAGGEMLAGAGAAGGVRALARR